MVCVILTVPRKIVYPFISLAWICPPMQWCCHVPPLRVVKNACDLTWPVFGLHSSKGMVRRCASCGSKTSTFCCVFGWSPLLFEIVSTGDVYDHWQEMSLIWPSPFCCWLFPAPSSAIAFRTCFVEQLWYILSPVDERDLNLRPAIASGRYAKHENRKLKKTCFWFTDLLLNRLLSSPIQTSLKSGLYWYRVIPYSGVLRLRFRIALRLPWLLCHLQWITPCPHLVTTIIFGIATPCTATPRGATQPQKRQTRLAPARKSSYTHGVRSQWPLYISSCWLWRSCHLIESEEEPQFGF